MSRRQRAVTAAAAGRGRDSFGFANMMHQVLTESAARPRALFSVASILLTCILVYGVADTLRFLPLSNSFSSFPSIFPSSALDNDSLQVSEENRLETVLNNAAMQDRTVILTTLNEAWAAPDSVIDLFLESFRIGDGTRKLLNHLVIIALDQKAFERCLTLHRHCFALITDGVDFHQEAYFMTPQYLKMMWKRIDFLRTVLEMGYNFIFTDADIMWFRDPFPRFYQDADFQVACDHFLGSPDDVQNRPNGGFNHVKSNNRSIEFYRFWYASRETYPGYHDQDVLNIIKFDPSIMDIGLKIKFLDTAYFGGLCEPSEDFNVVCTMHANCCYGLNSKLNDLRIMLQDWKYFLSLPLTLKKSAIFSWTVPENCSKIFPMHSPDESVSTSFTSSIDSHRDVTVSLFVHIMGTLCYRPKMMHD
ncbi:glycosyltransferase [Citrus sinensis]|uniref:Glycosyltransferase n=1 Tax=Citrus sinensis TaxID=2711 RepID=A0ACB8IMX1_CITSI|nr:glycosyltransferase [Citrus sinensis]